MLHEIILKFFMQAFDNNLAGFEQWLNPKKISVNLLYAGF